MTANVCRYIVYAHVFAQAALASIARTVYATTTHASACRLAVDCPKKSLHDAPARSTVHNSIPYNTMLLQLILQYVTAMAYQAPEPQREGLSSQERGPKPHSILPLLPVRSTVSLGSFQLVSFKKGQVLN